MHSPLATASRLMPYAVPGRYFENLAPVLIANMEDASVTTGKENVFSIPGNYFDQLPGQILATIRTEESIAAFPEHIPYENPENYFDALPATILHKARHEKAGAFIIKWQQAIRWAAAAILVLGVAFGAYKFFTPAPLDATKALAELPEETIREYLVQNIDDFDTELILNNLNTDKDIRSATGLDNEDIIQYLNETGWNAQTDVN